MVGLPNEDGCEEEWLGGCPPSSSLRLPGARRPQIPSPSASILHCLLLLHSPTSLLLLLLPSDNHPSMQQCENPGHRLLQLLTFLLTLSTTGSLTLTSMYGRNITNLQDQNINKNNLKLSLVNILCILYGIL